MTRPGNVTFSFYGRRVTSCFPLAPAEVASPAGGRRDLELLEGTRRPVPDEPPAGELLASVPHRHRAGRHFYTGASQAGGYVLRVHRLCDFEISHDLEHVVACVAVGERSAQVPALFTGTVMSFVLGLGGHPSLHASAVAYPANSGGVIAVMGAAGAGKSTVTGLFCAAGASFVTDDVLVVDVEEGIPTVAGGCYELRLRGKAIHLLDRFQVRPSTRPTADGRTAALLSSRDCGPRRLSCVVLPRPDREHDKVRVTRLGAKDALLAMLGAARLAGWAHPPSLVSHFDLAGRLAISVPVYEARIPWNPLASVEVARQLLDDLVGLTS